MLSSASLSPVHWPCTTGLFTAAWHFLSFRFPLLCLALALKKKQQHENKNRQ